MSLSNKPRRVPFLWILLPYALGIAMGSLIGRTLIWPLWLLGIAIALSALWGARRSTKLWICAILMCSCLAGMLRYWSNLPDAPPGEDLPPREAEIVFQIKTLFQSRDPAKVSGIGSIVDTPIHLNYLEKQKVYFSLSTNRLEESKLTKGERIGAIGLIEGLDASQLQAGFKSYLANQHVAFIYSRGDALAIEKRASSFHYWMSWSRERLGAVLANNKLPDSELTGAFKALMLGQKGELSSEQRELFLQNGTMHLFAISGLHIGVIATCIHQLVAFVRLPRRYRPAITLVFVLLFVLVTGGAASSWRALLMVACFYLCQINRRQASPLNALALSAIIYLVILPSQLFQAGFQMSYFTVASILMFGLPLARSLNQATPLFAALPHSLRSKFQRGLIVSKRWIVDGFGISVAAFTASSLLGAYYFHILPSYGILINLIALPLASLAIISGFIAILISPIPFPLDTIFNNAAITLIHLIQELLRAVQQLPLASIELENVSAAMLLVCLAVVGSLITWSYAKSESPKALVYQSIPMLGSSAALLLTVANS